MRNTKKVFLIMTMFLVCGLFYILPAIIEPTEVEAAVSGRWVQKTDGFYWIQEDGVILRTGGWQILDGKRYYLANKSGRRKTGWITYKEDRYYLDPETGILVTGLKKIDGSWYYLNEEGKLPGQMLKGFILRNGSRYFAQDNGKLVVGWRNIKGKKYYFGKDREAVSGWQTISERRYYFDDKEHYMKTGWLKRGKNSYYLNKSGNPVIGYLTVSGNKYYFKAPYGVMLKGWMTANNHKYYFDSKGVRQTGLKKIDGKYYFLNTTYGYMEKGWKTINGSRYYFDQNGIMKTGFVKIGSKNYLFGLDGKQVVSTRAYKVDGNYYTFASDGAAKKVTINAQILACERLEALGWDLRRAFEWAANMNYVSIDVYHIPSGYTESEYLSEFGLKNHYGECYVKACTFYQLANMLGYNVRFMKGYVPLARGGTSIHGWVEILYNGVWKVCDPALHYRTGRAYMFAYGTPGTWVYTGKFVADKNF